MESRDAKLEQLIAAWQTARLELRIQVVAPFKIKYNRSSCNCVAFLPQFGSPRGMILQAWFSPNFCKDRLLAEYAECAGLYLSTINGDAYSPFSSLLFKDTLNNWGYFGQPQYRPAWYSGKKWS
jgi:hypothetical protein